MVRGSTSNPSTATTIKSGRNHLSNLQVCQPPAGATSSSSDGFEEEAHDTAMETEGKANPDPNKVTHLWELMKKLCHEVDHYQYMAEYHEGEATHAKHILASIQHKVAKISRMVRIRDCCIDLWPQRSYLLFSFFFFSFE
ncbi:hypothetical protein AMTRI_Chr07g77920 [Amborella trichopoda]